MSGSTELARSGRQSITWETKGQPGHNYENSLDIHGVLFLDVDGTLTRPGSMYAIDIEAIGVITEFVNRGGVCVFNTGATLGRLERTILNPIFNGLDQIHNNTQTVSGIFRDRIIAMPENGSASLLNTGVEIVENELYFLWHVLHALHVPDKEKLRALIESELVPSHHKSFVVGDRPGEMNPRQYILSWKGITDTLELVEEIKRNIVPKHPKIDWTHIQMKAARKTIDFIHSESGKQPSSEWLLHEVGFIDGPLLGFGDLGDEFGRVIPTINVNQVKPNEFRRRSVPSMELTRWKSLSKNSYVTTGTGRGATVRDLHTGAELSVLRDEEGEIIYASPNDNNYLSPGTMKEGFPIEIKPGTYYGAGHQLQTIQDAGKGTAWVLRQLIDKGYFAK